MLCGVFILALSCIDVGPKNACGASGSRCQGRSMPPRCSPTGTGRSACATFLSFVFIYILALFPRKSALSIQLSALSHAIWLAQTPMCGVCDVPKGQAKTNRTICPNCAFGASQTFKSNVCANLRLFPRVLCFHIHSGFVPSKISFQWAASSSQPRHLAGADPDVWRLRCPEGTGRGERCNLPELRLRRIADVQKQRLRQPRTLLLSP